LVRKTTGAADAAPVAQTFSSNEDCPRKTRLDRHLWPVAVAQSNLSWASSVELRSGQEQIGSPTSSCLKQDRSGSQATRLVRGRSPLRRSPIPMPSLNCTERCDVDISARFARPVRGLSISIASSRSSPGSHEGPTITSTDEQRSASFPEGTDGAIETRTVHFTTGSRWTTTQECRDRLIMRE